VSKREAKVECWEGQTGFKRGGMAEEEKIGMCNCSWKEQDTYIAWFSGTLKCLP
jgi:hypothetical protein